MNNRSHKRQAVWEQMLQLEQDGLGHREQVSVGRDKFILDRQHRSASLLSRRPEANGFIRADEDTLLFRDVSDDLYARLVAIKPDRAIRSSKGFEVGWGALDVIDVERMFGLVRSIAQKAPSPTGHAPLSASP